MATKFILVESSYALDAVQEVGVCNGRPTPWGSKTLDASTGAGIDSNTDPDPNFANKLIVAKSVVITNQSDYRKDRQMTVAFADSAPASGKKLTAFQVLDGGYISQETINGVTYSFKKYSCTAED